VQSTRTNLIHSLKTHCFNCVKQSCRLRVIFYLREFCSLDTDSIEFFMSRSNRCHKSVWIYYYYYYYYYYYHLLITYWYMINSWLITNQYLVVTLCQVFTDTQTSKCYQFIFSIVFSLFQKRLSIEVKWYHIHNSKFEVMIMNMNSSQLKDD